MGTNVVTPDGYILFTLLMAASIGSMYLAGRIAERRGRSFKIWAWIAAIIGPLALPLVFLFPDLHGKNGDHAQARGREATRA
jgi:MFS family permease